ncbi:helicase-related protein [Arenibaculum pallidiluteum]|uniref:helicase-related protein n=1 Tax=Arenibaculum pallidiluteum TaxID=2812559 RepID=UPI001A97124C|nr:helicase-related protein [Arenibaculum pallidiluteum]
MSASAIAGRGRITAVLGPTNTGKTHLAIERMLAHRSGMIGFPLRLLARENYDRIVKARGPAAVALVTGEEKIVPPNPQYFVCTVESMPLDRAVAFLAVDEIQLCADTERGHVFTDRLLNARGMEETMFLGSDTIRPLIQTLVPDCEHVSRPRFSKLTYAGARKLTKLPPRSAVVAFSATEVYGIAELIRRQRGGTAVVLGALSPRTRNAQVGLYQAGEVDYLVATDAIGMGLNMDVDHVAFARLVKFDGIAPRRLRATEIAQIAGRAGRHMRDGTFGTTADVEGLDEETVDRVENHRFEPLKTLMWRNSRLRFESPQALLRSLEQRPAAPELIRAREADDQLALEALARDPEVAKTAVGRNAVALLWEVCQVPDFRKILSDAHTKLLSQLYLHLARTPFRLPEDWVARQVDRLDRTEGDIDALVARIAHVRTWTYVSNRPNWLGDAAHWQGRTREIEDKLSDALHERLTQRFIDRRSAMLVKSLKSGADLLGAVRPDGEVLVEGHPVGRIEGLRFVPDPDAVGEDARALLTAARRVLRGEIARRIAEIEAEGDDAFALLPDAVLVWKGMPVARLAPGPSILAPLVVPLHDDLLDSAQRDRLRDRLARWIEAETGRRLQPLLALRDADAHGVALTGAARGLAFQLVEALGCLPRADLSVQIDGLEKADRRALAALGVILGTGHVFMPATVRPQAVELCAILWAVRHGLPLPPPVPAPGRVAVPTRGAPRAFWEAVGYPPTGPRAIRVDMLERFERELYRRAGAGPLEATPDLAQLIGSSVDELQGVLSALGYRRRQEADGKETWKRRRGAAAQRRPGGAPRSAPVSDSPFAALRRIGTGR